MNIKFEQFESHSTYSPKRTDVWYSWLYLTHIDIELIFHPTICHSQQKLIKSKERRSKQSPFVEESTWGNPVNIYGHV